MDKWRENLNQALGEAPAAPSDELEQILRRARAERPAAQITRSRQVWPLLLCASSLALSVGVSFLLQPETGSDEGASPFTVFSIEATSPYDESLETIQNLADEIP